MSCSLKPLPSEVEQLHKQLLDAHMQPACLPPEDWIQARRVCINMVLGTDMKKHFDIVSRFQASPRLCCSGTCVLTQLFLTSQMYIGKLK